jgi:hypothetical protein
VVVHSDEDLVGLVVIRLDWVPLRMNGKQEFRRKEFGSRLLAAEGEGGGRGQ